MAYELRNNSGSLFRNKRKEQENHPDSTGTVMVEGVEYFINGWTKTTQGGEKWVSLSFRRKDQQPDRAGAGAKQGASRAQSTGGSRQPIDEIADDLPF